METTAARLIVCERTGRWALALRRELAASGVRVWETRSLADCRDELLTSPASFVVLELGGRPREAMRLLTRLPREFPAARLAIVAERAQADYELLMREAGAVCFLVSPRRAGLLARLARRHLSQSPRPLQSLPERIWSAFPWAEARQDARPAGSQDRRD